MPSQQQINRQKEINERLKRNEEVRRQRAEKEREKADPRYHERETYVDEEGQVHTVHTGTKFQSRLTKTGRQAVKESGQQVFEQVEKKAAEQGVDVHKVGVRTEVAGDQLVTTATKARGMQTGARSRPQRQFAISGAPAQLSGDKEAIAQVRYQALQQATARKQRQGGGVVTGEEINREIRKILIESGGVVTREKQSAQEISDFYNMYYSSDATRRQMELVDAEAKKSQDAETAKQVQKMYELGYQIEDVVLVDKETGAKTYSFVPREGVKQYEYAAPDPAHPHRVEKREVQTEVVLVDQSLPTPAEGLASPLFGLGDYFVNIGRTGQQVFEETAYGKSDVKLAREIEGETLGALFKAGKDVFEGKPSTLEQDIGNVGAFIQEYPLYSAGSLAGTAILTYFTAGAGPLVKAGRTALATARGAKTAQEARTAGVTAARVVNVQPTGVRAVKVTEGGLIASTPGRAFRLIQKVRGKPVKPGQADLFAIELKSEDIGYVSAKTGRTAIITERIGAKEGKDLSKNLAIESITDVYQSEAGVLKKVAPPGIGGQAPKEIPALVKSEQGVKVAEARPTGASVITFKNKDLLQSAKDTAKRQRQIKAASDALAQISGRGKPFRLFESKPFKAEKTSKTPLEIISIYSSDRELSAAQKLAIAEVTTSKKASSTVGKIGLGGGASIFAVKGSLGLGGATGAERKARKESESETLEILSVDAPAGFELAGKSLSFTESASKIKLVPDAGVKARGKAGSKLLDKITGKTSIDISGKLGTKAATRQLAGQRSKAALQTDNLLKTSTVTRQATRQRTRQATRTRQRLIRITKPRPGLLTFRFPARVGVKRAKKQKGGLGVTKVYGIGVKNILAPEYSIGPEKKKKKKGKKKGRK